MDDFVLFAHSAHELQQKKVQIEQFLQQRLSLQLHSGQTWLNTSSHGLSFLGRRIFPHYIRTRSGNYRRSLKKIQRRIRACRQGRISEAQLAQSLASVYAHHQSVKL